ncbi:MAG: N-acetylmuramoyl-L-alanine amidase, partial [Kiritimatiellae bacterium]|nr:N-acetylmuramoyl-L-alanine amidase [Kiritimatiellia bacterium]
SARAAAVCIAAAVAFRGAGAGAAPPAKNTPAESAQTAKKSAISTKWRSPRNKKRALRKSTRFIILHTTEGSARGALEKLSANGECHYVVDTDGKVYSIIDRGRIAYHAGLSMWGGLTGLDSHSIGIEVVGYHDKTITGAQTEALRKLLADLKRVYKIPDDKVLTHSMVAFGNPNHWHKRKHRGRKRCGMLFADSALRAKLGLLSKPAFDPDLKAGRLYDADPALTKILYKKQPSATGKKVQHLVAAPSAAKGGAKTGQTAAADSPSASAAAAAKTSVIGPGRSAWDIARDKYDAPTTTYRFPDGSVKNGAEITAKQWRAMPAGTVVSMSDEGDAPADSGRRGLLEIGTDGSAQDLAGDDIAASSTFYFPPGGEFSSGAALTLSGIFAMPPGTKMLVGYKSGGPVSAKRPVFSICGTAWNSEETFYWDPESRRIVSGGDIDEKNIPKGSIVFYRK